ncbi:hypothetical protein [Desulfofustis glycolicus]|uniref:DUF106 domain-containing protein n=1 Tax=Desulfofustis glycolicus DSM 9705 TaxID=1121409 RepID=A0A1M5Y1Z6_9BACT|nr:hypothetical protein [Desulfofustis glycolicus]MCB2217722.1 hypothetical protein [Desulfobulbaceae bacterium]SHI05834.1 hypothetical protein SAMN02745124_03553 [Desulfofustis glycolicus DSM 9705]
MDLQTFLTLIDPWLIVPYRAVAPAVAGYLLGTTILALYCVVIGDLSATLVAFLNRGYLSKLRRKMEHHHHLSEKALMMGDKESYKAVNKQGLDAFGYSFSMGAALFCVSIWPMPFALAWLNSRFAEAPLQLPATLPLLGGRELHYFTSFLLLYILARIGYSLIMGRVAWYKAIKARVTGLGGVPEPGQS